MKLIINNEKGNSLLLVLVIIILFSILGLVLTSLTTNGIAKNEIRENAVQAQDLSDKGSEFLINDINQYLTKEVARGIYGKDAFLNLLITTLGSNSYKCPIEGVNNADVFGVTIPGENESKTNVCIKGSPRMISSDEKDLYKREVDIISTGFVDGKKHTTKVTAIIGTDAVPDQLRYALSTNDGGNLYLHGGVEIQGDIKTDGHLILSDEAFWMSGSSPKWEPSVRTTILKDVKSITPKLIMRPESSDDNKFVYVVKNANNLNYNNHINNFNNYLDNNKLYTKIDPNDTKTIYSNDLPILYQNDLIKNYPNGLNSKQVLANTLFNSNTSQVTTKTLPGDSIEITDTVISNYDIAKKKYSTLSISKNNYESQFFNKKDIIFVGEQYNGECLNWTISGKSKTCTKYEKKYRSGDMTISNSSNAISLKGTYYVFGDLKIENVNLLSDAIIYVNGEVTITESTLNGIDNNSTLFIFSNGKINISNISSYNPSPSKIKGFFYSKENFLMYGVFSNIEIQGGISAKRIILSAVRGKANRNTPQYDSAIIQSQLKPDGTAQKDSRLNVIYDENIIKQYTTFKRDEEEEFITQINDPIIIDRTN